MRIKPIVSLVGALALAVSCVLASAGASTASPPRWSMTVTNLPTEVGIGSPIVTPGHRIAPPPIQTFSPIRTGRPNSRPVRRSLGRVYGQP